MHLFNRWFKTKPEIIPTAPPSDIHYNLRDLKNFIPMDEAPSHLRVHFHNIKKIFYFRRFRKGFVDQAFFDDEIPKSFDTPKENRIKATFPEVPTLNIEGRKLYGSSFPKMLVANEIIQLTNAVPFFKIRDIKTGYCYWYYPLEELNPEILTTNVWPKPTLGWGQVPYPEEYRYIAHALNEYNCTVLYDAELLKTIGKTGYKELHDDITSINKQGLVKLRLEQPLIWYDILLDHYAKSCLYKGQDVTSIIQHYGVERILDEDNNPTNLSRIMTSAFEYIIEEHPKLVKKFFRTQDPVEAKLTGYISKYHIPKNLPCQYCRSFIVDEFTRYCPKCERKTTTNESPSISIPSTPVITTPIISKVTESLAKPTFASIVTPKADVAPIASHVIGDIIPKVTIVNPKPIPPKAVNFPLINRLYADITPDTSILVRKTTHSSNQGYAKGEHVTETLQNWLIQKNICIAKKQSKGPFRTLQNVQAYHVSDHDSLFNPLSTIYDHNKKMTTIPPTSFEELFVQQDDVYGKGLYCTPPNYEGEEKLPYYKGADYRFTVIIKNGIQIIHERKNISPNKSPNWALAFDFTITHIAYRDKQTLFPIKYSAELTFNQYTEHLAREKLKEIEEELAEKEKEESEAESSIQKQDPLQTMVIQARLEGQKLLSKCATHNAYCLMNQKTKICACGAGPFSKPNKQHCYNCRPVDDNTGGWSSILNPELDPKEPNIEENIEEEIQEQILFVPKNPSSITTTSTIEEIITEESSSSPIPTEDEIRLQKMKDNETEFNTDSIDWETYTHDLSDDKWVPQGEHVEDEDLDTIIPIPQWSNLILWDKLKPVSVENPLPQINPSADGSLIIDWNHEAPGKSDFTKTFIHDFIPITFKFTFQDYCISNSRSQYGKNFDFPGYVYSHQGNNHDIQWYIDNSITEINGYLWFVAPCGLGKTKLAPLKLLQKYNKKKIIIIQERIIASLGAFDFYTKHPDYKDKKIMSRAGSMTYTFIDNKISKFTRTIAYDDFDMIIVTTGAILEQVMAQNLKQSFINDCLIMQDEAHNMNECQINLLYGLKKLYKKIPILTTASPPIPDIKTDLTTPEKSDVMLIDTNEFIPNDISHCVSKDFVNLQTLAQGIFNTMWERSTGILVILPFNRYLDDWSAWFANNYYDHPHMTVSRKQVLKEKNYLEQVMAYDADDTPDKKTGLRKRKIYFSTDILQESTTLPSINTIIDLGVRNRPDVHTTEYMNTNALIKATRLITAAEIAQVAGRVGRVKNDHHGLAIILTNRPPSNYDQYQYNWNHHNWTIEKIAKDFKDKKTIPHLDKEDYELPVSTNMRRGRRIQYHINQFSSL